MIETGNQVTNAAGPGYAAGRWYLILIGLFLVMAGLLFMGLMWRSYRRAKDMENWRQADCVILRSEVEERVVIRNRLRNTGSTSSMATGGRGKICMATDGAGAEALGCPTGKGWKDCPNNTRKVRYHHAG